jgi:hypothetical protein
MAGGQALNTLVDMFLATTPTTLTSVKMIENEAQFRSTFLYQVMRAHDMSQQVQGGSEIQDFVYFDEVNSASDYQPMEEFAPQLSQHLTRWSVPWRFTQVNEVFNKHEKGLQNIGQLNRGARAMVFKDLIWGKWMNVITSLNNHLERGFFLTPTPGAMEATSGKTPYSIFATITEWGTIPTAAISSGVGTRPLGFTTVQGIDPNVQLKWRNPLEFYTDVVGRPGLAAPIVASSAPLAPTSRWSGYSAFMRMYKRLTFEPLAIRPEYGSPQEPGGFIFTSLRGCSLYELNGGNRGDFLRAKANDPSTTMGGGNGELSYQGIPVRYVEKMDTAVVWVGGAASANAGEFDGTTDENGGAVQNPDSSGPRFVFNNPSKYKKIVHAEHWLEEETPPSSQTQPFDRVVYFDNWHNNICRSRRKAGGVVAPGFNANAVNAGTPTPAPFEDTDFTSLGI